MNKFKISLVIILLSFFCTPSLSAQTPDLTTRKDQVREQVMELTLLELAVAAEEPQKQEQLEAKVEPSEEEVETSEEKVDFSQEIAIGSEEESLAPPVQRGAWILKKGQFYAELYTKYYWHNHEFDANRKKKRWASDGKGNEIRTELKLEYGLTDRYTLMLSTVAKEAHWKDSVRSCTERGFVEIWPGVKYLLFTDPFICSLQLRGKFPFGYSEEVVPAIGTHQIDGEFRILTAQPWPKLPGYTKFEVGFRARNEEPSNEIPYFFELGYNLTPWVVLKTTLDCQEGLAATGGTNEDWLKYTVGSIFKFKDLFNIELSFGHTFFGKNTSAAKEIITTISYKW